MRLIFVTLSAFIWASCATAQQAKPVAKPAAAPAAAQPAKAAAAAKPAAQPAPAKPAAAPAAQAEGDEQLTVISSDKLTFDYKKKYALFEGNVVVTDPQLKLLADKMTVTFDDESKVKNIRAEGNVVMITDDKKSRSDTATYDVFSGEIVLEGSPQVTRGKDVLTGRRITFWRDSNRMKVEGGSTLFLHQNSKGTQGILDGGESGGGK